MKFTNDQKFIDRINSVQSSWTAVAYPHLEGIRMSQLIKRYARFVPKFRRHALRRSIAKIRRAIASKKQQQEADSPNVTLPDEFDWRNSTICGGTKAGGCVSPVRAQGGCGSCYSFSVMGMMESRVMVKSQGKIRPTFSVQDQINCNPYDQGCYGGYPYSASKYGQDYGITTEQCTPYVAHNEDCVHNKKCPDSTRTYVQSYKYCGGFYGANTEQNIMQAIYEGGAVSIDFAIYKDFWQYKSGVYRHINATELWGSESSVDHEDPVPHWEETDHSVLAVGWGITEKGEKYWIIKNTWGENWGLRGYGYFWILRGVDECAIESGAVEAEPIVAA